MSYIEQNLGKNEQIVYRAHISVWSLLPQIILGFIFLSFYGLGLIFFIAAFLRYISTELAITNKRVVAKFGFIRRNTIELNLNKVESVRVEQGILGRMLNYGSIFIAGAGLPQAPVPGISTPLAFRAKVFDVQEDMDNAGKTGSDLVDPETPPA